MVVCMKTIRLPCAGRRRRRLADLPGEARSGAPPARRRPRSPPAGRSPREASILRSAMEVVRPMGAVAERLVSGSPAAAERRSLAFVEEVALGVDDAHAAGDEQRPVLGGADLFTASGARCTNAEPPRPQRTGGAPSNRVLDLVRRRCVHFDPRPPPLVEHLRQRTNTVAGVEAQAAAPTRRRSRRWRTPSSPGSPRRADLRAHVLLTSLYWPRCLFLTVATATSYPSRPAAGRLYGRESHEHRPPARPARRGAGRAPAGRNARRIACPRPTAYSMRSPRSGPSARGRDDGRRASASARRAVGVRALGRGEAPGFESGPRPLQRP